jgi:hypothetical protein
MKPYIVEEIDNNMFIVGLALDYDNFHYHDWCEDNIAHDWGIDMDEFYSPHSCGTIFWFSNILDWKLFRMYLELK